MNSLYERICRRLLSESAIPNVSEYGVLHDRGTKSSTVYNIAQLKDTILGSEKLLTKGMRVSAIAELFQSAVVAYVSIVKPKDPCHGAYQISKAVGSGKLAYACAYAMSPTGLMISDRNEISPKAVAAWNNMASKNERDRLELDDISLPKEQRKTPDFKGDDCKVWKDEPQLNYAYRAEGWEEGTFEEMKANHANFVKNLKNEIKAVLKTKRPDATKEEISQIVTRISNALNELVFAGENVFFDSVKSTEFMTHPSKR